MAELPIMPLKTDALLADTMHMTAEEFGVYCRLLFVMWRHGGKLQDSDSEMAAIGGVTAKRWQAIKEKVIRPMTVIGGLVSQKRLTDTWTSVQDKRRKNAEAGLSGAGERWKSTTIGDRKLRSQRLSAAREKGRHSKEEWASLVEICGNGCVKCGRLGPVVKDHIQPIYRGGSDGIENLQPLCVPCNTSKGPDDTDHRPDGWHDALRMPSERLMRFSKTSGAMPSNKNQTSIYSSFSTAAREEESGLGNGNDIASPELAAILARKR